jgi:LPS-assembly protein
VNRIPSHIQNFGHGFGGNFQFSSVSDYIFMSDLAGSLTSNAQTNLLRQGTITYGASWWAAAVTAQSYQTLQNPYLPLVAEPYKRLPQITLSANRSDLPLGGVFNFGSEYVSSQPKLLKQRA